jgi:hypothetical protein
MFRAETGRIPVPDMRLAQEADIAQSASCTSAPCATLTTWSRSFKERRPAASQEPEPTETGTRTKRGASALGVRGRIPL